MKNYTIRIIVVALGAIIINSCGSKKATITSDQIMGYWKTIVGENEYVQFEKIDSEYVYSAFTYDRLASSGIWELDGDNLTLGFDDGSTVTLEVSFKGDTMLLNNGAEKYVRAIISGDGKTPVTDIGDVEVLESIIKNINSVFSEPEPFTEDWVSKDISWQKIATEVILKQEGFADIVEVANQVSKYLVSQGFNIDKARVTETVSSYKKGNLIVMVRLRGASELTAGETAYVDVISGIET